MAVVISPSNNTGWGLGVRSMYGGAKEKSAQHPVYVSAHYRAGWGTINRRHRPSKRSRSGKRRHRVIAPMDPITAAQVEATIDEVARNGPSTARQAIEQARYNLRKNNRHPKIYVVRRKKGGSHSRRRRRNTV